MSNELDELITHIRDSAVPVNGLYVLRADAVAEELLGAGYRKITDQQEAAK
jgi:hypothetical protein